MGCLVQSRVRSIAPLALPLALVLSMPVPARAQYGIVLPGAGPVNRSMGGAAIATALDATGALLWNPAAISGLDGSQVDFAVLIKNYANTQETTRYSPAKITNIEKLPMFALAAASAVITYVGQSGGRVIAHLPPETRLAVIKAAVFER